MTISNGVQYLDEDSSSVIEALSQVPAKELVILITQHAGLPKVITRSLHILAFQSIQNGFHNSSLLDNEDKNVQAILNILRRLIDRGDPSQARRLVPSQAALTDLALCTSKSKDILARLLDETGTEEILKAAFVAFNEACQMNSFSSECIGRAAFVLARLLYTLPRWKHTSNTNRRGQTTRYPAFKDTEKLLKLVQKQYDRVLIALPISEGENAKLLFKVSLIDLVWALLERQMSIEALSSAEIQKLVEDLTRNHLGSIPLIDLPLLVDLAIIKPLLPMVRKISAARSSVVDSIAQRIEPFTSKKGNQETQIDQLGVAWQHLAISVKNQPHESSTQDSDIDGELLSTVLAIIPQWEQHIDELKSKLSSPPYLGQSNDTIVQLLLDEGDPINTIPEAEQQPFEDPMEYLRQRGNVFDDESLNSAKMLIGAKGKGRMNDQMDKVILGSGLSDEMKAAILARAEAPDSDEEDREEWDPFAESSAGARTLEVGFEEELDDGEGDFPPIERSIHRAAGGEYGVDEEDVEEAESGGRHGAAAGSVSNQSNMESSVEVEKASERILITAFKEHGQTLFEKQDRGSKNRKSLIEQLNRTQSQTKKWDDQLIESWATMFNRNPRKDKLLAAVDDVMRYGNPNHAQMRGTGEDPNEKHSPFGPDRGRGGRILRGGHSDRGSGGRGGGNRGRGRGGGGNRGNRGNRGRGGGGRGH